MQLLRVIAVVLRGENNAIIKVVHRTHLYYYHGRHVSLYVGQRVKTDCAALYNQADMHNCGSSG